MKIEKYIEETQRGLAFESKVASWAIGLNAFSCHMDQFVAMPKARFDHEGSYEGTTWAIRTGTPYSLIVEARFHNERIAHITARLECRASLFRDYQSDALISSVGADDMEEAVEMADMFVESFDGHVVASWWPNERQLYARWLAQGKPDWKHAILKEWLPE